MKRYYLENDRIGMIREIDNLGRLVIPKELRTMYKLDKEVEVIPTQEGVLLRNPEYRLVRVLKAVERKKQF